MNNTNKGTKPTLLQSLGKIKKFNIDKINTVAMNYGISLMIATSLYKALKN